MLPEMICNMLLYGIIIQFAGVWFVEDKLRYTTGLWIGIAVAAGMAIHMAVLIMDAVDMMAASHSTARTAVFSVLRYVVVVIVFLLVWYFELGNLIVMFIGVMGLKAAAYLQPFTHKFIMKYRRKGDDASSDKIE